MKKGRDRLTKLPKPAAVQTSSPADDPPSEAVPNKIAEIDTFLTSCPVQFQADKLEERDLRIKNYTISKTKNRKAGEVKHLERSRRAAARALSEARLPYNELKTTELGKAVLDAIAPFAKDEGFIQTAQQAMKTLLLYRTASIEAAAFKAKHTAGQEELLQMEKEFKQREARADEIAASVAASVQQMELEEPKPRGRPRLRRASTMSLGADDDEAFSSAEDAAAAAAAAMSGLSGGAAAAEDLSDEREQASQSLACVRINAEDRFVHFIHSIPLVTLHPSRNTPSLSEHSISSLNTFTHATP